MGGVRGRVKLEGVVYPNYLLNRKGERFHSFFMLLDTGSEQCLGPYH